MQQAYRAEYVKRFGGCGSVAILDPSCSIFSHPSIDGIIGYNKAYGCAIAFGEPLCAPEYTLALSQAFHHYCQQERLSTIYAIVSEDFARKAPAFRTLVEFGEELCVNPLNDLLQGPQARKLRNKISLAQRMGITVKEYTTDDPKLRSEIEKVGQTWLEGRSGPQIFLANVHLFAEVTGKRWFYAQHNGHIIGVVLLNRLDAQQGWLFNLLLTTPEAPGGTSELLVVKVLEILRKENCEHASFGPVTCADLGQIEGLGKLTSWCARKGFQIAKKVFSLDAKRKYWKKYQPHSQKAYILSSDKIYLRQSLALMKALNVSYKGS